MTRAEPAGIVRRIYGNLGRLLTGKAAAGLIGLAYMVIAARILGPRDYGILVLVHAYATSVGGIVNFPGWHAVVRYGARWRSQERFGEVARLLRFTGVVELAAGLAAVLVAAALAPMLGPHLGWSRTALAFAIPYSLAVLASVRSTPAGYLQLVGRFDLLAIHNTIAPTVRLAGAVAAWALGAGLTGFLIAWLIAALAEFGSLWVMGFLVARKEMPGTALLGNIGGVTAANPGIWRFMLIANADTTFGELAGRVTPLIIGWTLGPAAVGLYAVAQRATVVIAQPAAILGQAAYAELASLVATGEAGRPLRRAVFHCVAIAAAASIPVILVIVAFGRQIASLIGGASFASAATLMVWLSVARAALLIGPPTGAALIALGRPSRTAGANLIANLVLLPLLPPLLLRHGLVSAGWFALFQAIVAAGLLIAFLLRESARHETASRR